MPTRSARLATLTLAPALATLAAATPAQQLLRDVNFFKNRGAPSVWNASAAVTNGVALLAINGGSYWQGTEPWITDGTEAGTRMLVDLSSAPQGSVPYGFAALNGGVVFQANTSNDLWWSDGSAANTVRLGPISTSIGTATVVGNLAYYAASAPSAGIELWATDGTPAGTRLVADLAPGSASSEPTLFTDAGGGIAYFLARLPNGTRLLRTDGTAAGTWEVAPAIPHGSVGDIGVAGGNVFFATQSGQTTFELWVTDGTPAGTTQLRAGFRSLPGRFAALGNRVVFAATDTTSGGEPWISDGTVAGTRLLLDVRPGPASSVIGFGFGMLGTVALFAADDGTHGFELWRTDGTTAGTTLVADINPGIDSSFPLRFLAFGGRLWFLARDAVHGEELWSTDGTASGTSMLLDIHPTGNSDARPMTELNGALLFSADDGRNGIEPWITDGTSAGTRRIGDFAWDPLGSNPHDFTALGLRTLFAADDGRNGVEPWISDGTRAGTQLLHDVEPGASGSAPRVLAEWKGRTWFAATTSAHGSEPWSTDGTAAGTAMLADLQPGGASSYPTQLLPLGDRALLTTASWTTQGRLFVTDGTAAGTTELVIDPAVRPNPTQLVELGGIAWFVATHSAHGTELWRSDGTQAGTSLVADIAPGPASTSIIGLTAVRGLLYFSGSTTFGSRGLPTDLEPWVSDGTAAGTMRLADLVPGLGSSSPANFVEFGGRTWFTATQPDPTTPLAYRHDLLVTDGTAAGTTTVVPSIGTEGPLVVAGERMFFRRGSAIWSTDGTPAGTSITRDIWPGATGARVEDPVAAGSGTLVVFSARSLDHGQELFVSDGTAAGTRLLRDIWPGVLPSNPGQITRVGDAIWFAADDPVYGVEPFVLPLAEIGGALAEAIARGCPGSNGTPAIGSDGIPRLGEPAFTITLERALPGAPTWLFLSAAVLPGADLGRCVPAMAPPAIAATFPVDGAGRAAATLAVPATPSLQGARLFAQWLIFDPNGGMWRSLALSDILDLVVGS